MGLVGLDPGAADALASVLDDASEDVGSSRRVVAGVLADVGRAASVPQIAAAEVWAQSAATDLRRRALKIAAGRWVAGMATEWPGWAARGVGELVGAVVDGLWEAARPGGVVPSDPAERLLVLLGVTGAGGGAVGEGVRGGAAGGHGAGIGAGWLGRAYPGMAAARREAAGVMQAASRARGLLAFDFHAGRVDLREAEARRAAIERLEAWATVQGRPTAAGVAAELAALTPSERERVARELGRWAASRDPAALAEVERRYLRGALAPVRSYLAGAMDRVDAVDRVDGSGDEDVASLVAALEFPVDDDPHGALTFLDGLVRGSWSEHGYDGGEQVAFIAGQFISGLVVVGDVRDLAGSLRRGDWGGAALDGAGVIPIAGDALKGAKAADAAGDAWNTVRRTERVLPDQLEDARRAGMRGGDRAEDWAYLPRGAPPDGSHRRLLGGGLLGHEGVNGSHTIARHVGKSHLFLERRLLKEGHIPAAATFDDLATGEWAVAEVLHRRADEVSAWLLSGSGGQKFVADVGVDVGDVLVRGAKQIERRSEVIVVLRRDDMMRPHGWRVHTAYPLHEDALQP